MLFQNITIIDETFRVKSNMFVGVQGNRIGYIGTQPPQKDFGRNVDGNHRLLMPGFRSE